MNFKTSVILVCFIFCTVACTPPTPTPDIQPTFTHLPVSKSFSSAEEEQFARLRQELVQDAIVMQNLRNPDVIRAFGTVARHYFVLPEYVAAAYEDHALPIGYGQTISQPSLVARMTELLELKSGEKVLEIGTGSGYQAGILAELGYMEVYTIEIVPELAARATQTLQSLGYANIHTKTGDGYFGWDEHAPYDAIIVTAAPDHLPPPLAAQLKEGGRLVIPIGPPGWYQTLWKFTLQGGELKAQNMGGVIFVPFTGAGVEKAEQTLSP